MEKLKQISKKELKESIDMFLRVSLSAVCNCYDHTEGLYPDSCTCESREKVQESISALIAEHKRIIQKLELDHQWEK